MAGTVDRVMSLDIQDASSAKEAAISEAAVHIEGSAGSFAANGPVGPDGKPLQFENGRPVVSPEDEKLMKRLKLKLDMWILPILTVVMLLGSMDKSDVSPSIQLSDTLDIVPRLCSRSFPLLHIRPSEQQGCSWSSIH